MEAAGHTIAIDELLQLQKERDDRDEMREIAPLRPAADAILVDTTHRSPEQVIDFLVDTVLARRTAAGAR
jgi:cytidylate kinase